MCGRWRRFDRRIGRLAGALTSRDGSPADRANWRLIGHGEGIHWPELDEDISILGLLTGKRRKQRAATMKWRASTVARSTFHERAKHRELNAGEAQATIMCRELIIYSFKDS